VAATAGIENLGDLPKDIGEVESKHTSVAGDVDKVPHVFRRAPKHPQRRKVYFYDTSNSDAARPTPFAGNGVSSIPFSLEGVFQKRSGFGDLAACPHVLGSAPGLEAFQRRTA
jgi:hypothetical protein